MVASTISPCLAFDLFFLGIKISSVLFPSGVTTPNLPQSVYTPTAFVTALFITFLTLPSERLSSLGLETISTLTISPFIADFRCLAPTKISLDLSCFLFSISDMSGVTKPTPDFVMDILPSTMYGFFLDFFFFLASEVLYLFGLLFLFFIITSYLHILCNYFNFGLTMNLFLF